MVAGKRLSVYSTSVPYLEKQKLSSTLEPPRLLVLGGPDSIAKRFKLRVCGAKSAPPLGPDIYTVRCSVPLVVREPYLYSISQYLVASIIQSLLL